MGLLCDQLLQTSKCLAQHFPACLDTLDIPLQSHLPYGIFHTITTLFLHVYCLLLGYEAFEGLPSLPSWSQYLAYGLALRRSFATVVLIELIGRGMSINL